MGIKLKEGQDLNLGLGVLNLVVGIVFFNVLSPLNFFVAALCFGAAFEVDRGQAQ